MGSKRDEVAHVAEQIERYLARHPNASDTLDGVHAWWLDPAARGLDKTTVQAALELLIRRGSIASRTLGDGTVLYHATRH